MFTTNWHIYKARLSAPSKNPENEFITVVLKLQNCMQDEEFSSLKASVLRKSFSEVFLEAVDEALASLGDSCKEAIYYHLENSFKIARKDIPSKIEEFANAIESIFGFGAKIIQIQIMKNLYAKTGEFKYYPKDENLSFTNYAAAVKALHYSLNTAKIQQKKNKHG